MLKYMKKYSLVAITLALLIGCNSNSDGDSSKEDLSKDSNPVTIENLKIVQNSINKNTRSSVKSLSTKVSDEEIKDPASINSAQICESGSMNFNLQEAQNKFDFEAKECKIEQSTINGALKIEGDKNGMNIEIKVTKELSIKDQFFSLLAKKDSHLSIKSDMQNNITISSSFDLLLDQEEIRVDDFVIKAKENDTSISFYMPSGEMRVGKEYLKVDPSYDGSKTPFIINDDDSLVTGGLMKFLDILNHKIEIEAISSNEIEFRVDENGDGVFSENEKLIQNLDE